MSLSHAIENGRTAWVAATRKVKRQEIETKKKKKHEYLITWKCSKKKRLRIKDEETRARVRRSCFEWTELLCGSVQWTNRENSKVRVCVCFEFEDETEREFGSSPFLNKMDISICFINTWHVLYKRMKGWDLTPLTTQDSCHVTDCTFFFFRKQQGILSMTALFILKRKDLNIIFIM